MKTLHTPCRVSGIAHIQVVRKGKVVHSEVVKNLLMNGLMGSGLNLFNGGITSSISMGLCSDSSECVFNRSPAAPTGESAKQVGHARLHESTISISARQVESTSTAGSVAAAFRPSVPSRPAGSAEHAQPGPHAFAGSPFASQ